jgi:hypothetical protein
LRLGELYAILTFMDGPDSVEKMQDKVRRLEKELAETHHKLQYSGIELDAN